jgi:diacylglycerol O-acyltransferase / wax synthase
VRRLGAEDSGFLALELPGLPMTNLYLIVFAPGQAPLTLAQLRAHLDARLEGLPALRWKLAKVPLGLHHPYWIDDAEFDLARHLTQVKLSPAGKPAALADLCGKKASQPLVQSRPLWDITLVDGLAGGRQALIWRAHHCLMDGVATVTTLARFFAPDRDLASARSSSTAFSPGEPPPRGELVRHALRAYLHSVVLVPGLLRRTVRALRARDELEREAGVEVPRAPRDVPSCSLNPTHSPRRELETFVLDLAPIKIVREAAKVSFTDVVAAVIAGALRTVLIARGDLPQRPLIAGCPILLEDGRATERQWGNRFSHIVTTLATDISDPWERLETISAVTAAARRGVEVVGEKVWEDWLETLPPFVMAAAVRHLHKHRRRHPDVANSSATISSVPGPAVPWRLGDLEVEEVYITGQPRDAGGPAVSIFSYTGKLCVGVTSLPGSLPDLEVFAAAARKSLSELVERAADPLVR